MLGFRTGLCLALLLALAGSIDAGHRRQKSGCCGSGMAGYQTPYAAYGVPTPYASPQAWGTAGYAGGPFGPGFGYGPVPGYDVPMRFPTVGIVPPVAPGDELVW